MKRILQQAGFWETVEAEAEKKRAKPTSRTADQPEQTVNVDLCSVPARHTVADKLPVVSDSSGRLIVQRSPAETSEREWPGRVFEDPALTYEETMLKFVAASQAQAEPSAPTGKAEPADEVSWKATKRTPRHQEGQLRAERRPIRAKRKLEDAAWQAARAARKAQERACQVFQAERHQQRQAKQAGAEQWQALRQQRQAILAAREREDETWRQKRRMLRERLLQLPVVTAWIAILVIIDNCTRQCLSLPLFVASPKVTAKMIVEALQALLPPELQFLISDRGTHFKANAFKTLVLSEEFIHVLIPRRRPQSNGIAERFVRTLKE
jgi:transposase InsO family protein